MREVRQGSLDDEERTKHIDGVDFTKCFRGALFDCVEAGDAGVVDEDVDLEFSRFRVREVVFRGSN